MRDALGNVILTTVCKNQRLCAKNYSRTLFVIVYFLELGPSYNLIIIHLTYNLFL
jgi:hypothetical protein